MMCEDDDNDGNIYNDSTNGHDNNGSKNYDEMMTFLP